MLDKIVNYMLDIECTDKIHKYSMFIGILIVIAVNIVMANTRTIQAATSINTFKSVTFCNE